MFYKLKNVQSGKLNALILGNVKNGNWLTEIGSPTRLLIDIRKYESSIVDLMPELQKYLRIYNLSNNTDKIFYAMFRVCSKKYTHIYVSSRSIKHETNCANVIIYIMLSTLIIPYEITSDYHIPDLSWVYSFVHLDYNEFVYEVLHHHNKINKATNKRQALLNYNYMLTKMKSQLL